MLHKRHKSTNRPLSIVFNKKTTVFSKTRDTETGIIDYHKLKSSCYTHLKPHIIYYTNYNNLNEKLFVRDLEISNLENNSDNPYRNYVILIETS